MDRSTLERELEALHRESWAWALVCAGHDRADAEDALQTAYLRVLDGRARFGGRSTFRTWFFGVIRRVAAEQRRRRWWRIGRGGGGGRGASGAVHAGGAPGGATGAAVPLDRYPDPRPCAQEELEREERAARLLAAVEALPKRQQEVLELVFYHGMTIAQSADVIGVSLGTARTHYERGKRSLARVLTLEMAPAEWRSEG